ncbi:MAG: hypothetical protein RLZZ502_732, partial [Pseudomonadota bacterium]
MPRLTIKTSSYDCRKKYFFRSLKLWATASSVLLAIHSLQAQASDAPARHERAKAAVVEATDGSTLSRLSAEFRRKYEADEAAVAAYLAANPTLAREVIKDGVLQRIVRIGSDGNPVFIKSKATRGASKSNVESGQLIKADSLYPGGSIGVDITGQSMEVGVWEPGVPRVTHELLTGKATIQAGQLGSTTTASKDHATHVTGTIVGKSGLSGSGTSARGIAYSATAKNWDSSADTSDMATAAAAGMLVSNHSYGYANDNTTPQWTFGAYDSESVAWDTLTAAAPYYLPFVAAGNEQQANGNSGKPGYITGFDLLTGASAAKNVMTVGAVNADKSMSSYSNFGPTDDGRIKPEIVARGTGINSATSASDTSYSGDGSDSSGTSYATPAATAGALLLQQYYNSVHGSYMRASTLKALMIGTAEDLGNPGPDLKFGWGLLDVEAAANAIKKRSINTSPSSVSYRYPATKGAIIEEITANPTVGAEMSRDFHAKGGVPIVATICWTDDVGDEQLASEGTDPTTKRAKYVFGLTLRAYSDASFSSIAEQTYHWLTPSMTDPNANATKAINSSTAHPNNCAQVVSNTLPVAGNSYKLYIRKQTGSPVAARVVSLVITGVNDTGITVTASAGSNGTLQCGSPLANTFLTAPGASLSCTATPASGYRTVSITGCDGTTTAAGTNAYTTGAVNAACTVSATFELIPAAVNGACGTDHAVASVNAPSSNLCSAGSSSSVTSTSTAHTWSCAGSNGGTTASCSAPRQYAVTASPGANGGLTCVSPVTVSNTSTCTATPASGYRTVSITGCDGTATSTGVDSYTTGAVNVACSVSATFEAIPPVAVNGSCGTANGIASLNQAVQPALCSAGTVAALTSTGNAHTWNCTGSNGGNTASCSAPRLIPTQQAGVTAQFSALGCSNVDSVQFVNATTPLPSGASNFPFGLVDFVLSGCGSTAGISITYSQALPANARYYKLRNNVYTVLPAT